MSDGMSKTRVARFKLGQVVRHRRFAFRGVIFDIDPEGKAPVTDHLAKLESGDARFAHAIRHNPGS